MVPVTATRAYLPVDIPGRGKRNRRQLLQIASAALGLCAGCSSVEPAVPSPLGGTLLDSPRSDAAHPGVMPPAAAAPRHATLAQEPERQAGPAPATAAWGEGSARSFLIPAVDILGFEILLNQYDRHFDAEADAYQSDASSIKRNLKHGWVIDDDPFATNQFLHPYAGSMYHGFARSAGLGYWESLAYDFGGSALWEIAGETVPPSLNDQITTTLGGSFLGEALFRMASFTLEGGGTDPGFARRTLALLVSPATGINRLAYGDRFDAVYQSHGPATFARAGIGVRRNEKLSEVSSLGDLQRDEVVADVVMDYGLPGKPGYEYDRPFDYFHFEVTAVSSTSALPEDVMIRGLLFGSRYEVDQALSGVWGLYGGYDYISPEVFSVSSTSLSVGTTGQWRIADAMVLQATCLAGIGWAAAGTIADASVDRTYHYGVSPQGLAALRLVFGETAALDLTGRNYYIDPWGNGGRTDSETILRGKVALTARVYGRHCLGVQYIASSRDATFSNGTDTYQSIGALSVFYTIISDTGFGAVDGQ